MSKAGIKPVGSAAVRSLKMPKPPVARAGSASSVPTNEGSGRPVIPRMVSDTRIKMADCMTGRPTNGAKTAMLRHLRLRSLAAFSDTIARAMAGSSRPLLAILPTYSSRNCCAERSAARSASRPAPRFRTTRKGARNTPRMASVDRGMVSHHGAPETAWTAWMPESVASSSAWMLKRARGPGRAAMLPRLGTGRLRNAYICVSVYFTAINRYRFLIMDYLLSAHEGLKTAGKLDMPNLLDAAELVVLAYVVVLQEAGHVAHVVHGERVLPALMVRQVREP